VINTCWTCETFVSVDSLKRVGVILMNCVCDLYFIVFYERALVGQCTEYTNMRGMSNIHYSSWRYVYICDLAFYIITVICVM